MEIILSFTVDFMERVYPIHLLEMMDSMDSHLFVAENQIRMEVYHEKI